MDVGFNYLHEQSMSLREILEARGKGPLAKLAAAVLVDCAKNIIEPQDTYCRINQDKDKLEGDSYFNYSPPVMLPLSIRQLSILYTRKLSHQKGV